MAPLTTDLPAICPRLLIVDDEPALLESLGRSFREAGFEVGVAATSAEALLVAREGAYDAALIDCRLPDLPGTTLHQCMAALELRSAGCTLFMSGALPTASARLYIDERSRGFLPKPFDGAQAVAAIRVALG